MPGADRPTLTRIRGVRVGHAETPEGTSGVTAILFDRAAPTVVDDRGGASCTYDVASLDLGATFGRRWALFFSGGSLYGLDAARGIRTQILTGGGGHRAFQNPNPVVPISGACLFDLPTVPSVVPDYLPLGFEAARMASRHPILPGKTGAGAGARVGKYLGIGRSSPGGLASAAAPAGGRQWIGALVVLNPVGAVRDPSSGRWISGARDSRGRVVPPTNGLPVRAPRQAAATARGTTLVSIVTDVSVDRRTLHRIAIAGQAGMARAVTPVHSATDGDVVFASTTNESAGPPRERYPGELGDRLGALASELVVRAIVEAARAGTRSLTRRRSDGATSRGAPG